MAFEWLMGLGIMFGMGLVLTIMDSKEFSLDIFFGYTTFFSCFVVWFGFLPDWVMIINFLILIFLVITKVKGENK